jgi:hypothetical protein
MTKQLSRGMIIKVRRNSERFFVKIRRITRENIYAEVKNKVILQPFRYGNVIAFKRNEVLEIYEL